MPSDTHVTGSATLRPLALGICLNLADGPSANEAMQDLSSRWGGCFCALLPHDLSDEQLLAAIDAYGLDGVWSTLPRPAPAHSAEGRVVSWWGSGQWTPLGADRLLGLLPWAALHDPTHSAPSADQLIHFLSNPAEPFLLSRPPDAPSSRLLQCRNTSPPVVMVIDRDSIRDQVEAWNVRSTGAPLVALDRHRTAALAVDEWTRLQTWVTTAAINAAHQPGASRDQPRVYVRDLGGGSEAYTEVVARLRNLGDMDVVGLDAGRLPHYRRSLTSPFRQTFSVTILNGSFRAAVPLPALPVDINAHEGFASFNTVAVEVTVNEVRGTDPRLTATLPADGRFADLLTYVVEDLPRLVRPTEEGFVAAVSANTPMASVQLHRKTDVFRRFFGPDVQRVEQSDEGLFQSRAGAMVGGMTSAWFTQHAAAAAMSLLAEHPQGVVHQRLRAHMALNQGRWPGPLSVETNADYVDRVMHQLIASGLVSVFLHVKCSFCRSAMQLSPAALADQVPCDFCGQVMAFAPLLGWGSPQWRYRLAGHLSVAQVRAMVPVLAAMGQIAQLQLVQGDLECVDLGLKVTGKGRSAEADIIAYLREPIPVVLLGEVKGANRIDAEDVDKLSWLQSLLNAQGHASVLVFATSKPAFGAEEVELLRSHCEHAPVMVVRGAPTPRLPLLLTGEDLFLPGSDEASLRHWGRGDATRAVFGVAIESCRRNLGLQDWQTRGSDRADLVWREDWEVAVEQEAP